MTSWSAKRRFAYGGSVILVFAILFGLVFWKTLYRTPTCSDGVKNGDEKGVDCGGACQKICTSDALAPVVLWSKIFNISGDVYSAVAYVENPNINSINKKAEYQFQIFDAENKLLTVVQGETSIPKNKKFAVFETGVVLKGNKPKSADFKFLTFSPWEKDTTPDPQVSLSYSTLLLATTTPRITGTITNNGLGSVDQLELVALVSDNNENIVAAGRTFIDNLLRKTSQDFVFTWPKAFNLGVEACVSPLDLVVALDRSGSMKSESINPPEPFTTVISTAQNFIKNLGDSDKVGVVSFGTNSKQESFLSSNKDLAAMVVKNIMLSTTTLEQTNITGGLQDAWTVLRGDEARDGSKKVVVLLTDGIPTEPTDKNIPDYPTVSALNVAKQIKDSGVVIYTIGLGKNVSEGFLKGISSDDAHYFLAPTKEILSSVYSKISQSVCTKKPNAITVIYRLI